MSELIIKGGSGIGSSPHSGESKELLVDGGDKFMIKGCGMNVIVMCFFPAIWMLENILEAG